MKNVLKVMWEDVVKHVGGVLRTTAFVAGGVLALFGAATTIVFLLGGLDSLNIQGQIVLKLFWTLAPIVAIICWVISAIKRGGKS